jgi:exopolysaccharide biosynthesis polyprenyl glycosylphosphotransferase
MTRSYSAITARIRSTLPVLPVRITRYYQYWAVRLAEIFGWLNIVDRSLIAIYLASKGNPDTAIHISSTELTSVPNHLIWPNTVKAIIDKVFSVVFIILLSTLFIIISIAIKLDSPGPILYRQARVGLHGRVFTIFKFRSMRVDAKTDGRRRRWASERDPRVTRIGAVIRKLRIDELAQIFNVLRGEMSFVGPRPERPFLVAELTQAIPYYSERHRVKPGITGWAQVNGLRGGIDTLEETEYDLYYIEHWSLRLDLKILRMSIGRLLSHKDAY